MVCKIEEKINEKGNLDKKDLELIYEIVRRQLKFMIKYNILMIPKNFSILFRIFCNIVENNRNVSERDILAMYKADLNDLEMSRLDEKLLEVESRKDITDKLELIAEEIDEKVFQILEVMNLHQENIAKHENIIKENEDSKFLTILEHLKKLKQRNDSLMSKLEEYHKEIIRLNTELKVVKQEATLDFLTSLANRRSFDRALNDLIKDFNDKKIPFTLILLDLDNFKQINDKFGHPAGDLVLKEVSNLLRTYLRANTIIGRLGGEEFGIILPNVTLENGKNVAERIRNVIENHEIKYDGKVIKISASLGVTQVKEGDTIDTLYRRVDEALYQAKRDGKNKVIVAE